MEPIDYFKLQAKNLFKDYKTQTPPTSEDDYYEYHPTYFDILGIFLAFTDLDEENFTLMKAQHVIAQLAGFYKWTDMLKASTAELELGKLLFDNQDKLSIDDWEIYLNIGESDYNITYTPEQRLEIFKVVFLNGDGYGDSAQDFRLPRT
ncbi:hypothetical protein [Mucilaginibacter sp. BT774]|uniref:hypothetical protein n=1 Tax=Mucilaginibacter sp. BT774 TaxID=3062276 RepID=UPI0026757C85|nr:hypothetical protein [Mucilaginibacter sp. BT774]MDO3627591.1 hypothetical protein [Mucilaginibacter sp. BT774]